MGCHARISTRVFEILLCGMLLIAGVGTNIGIRGISDEAAGQRLLYCTVQIGR